MIVHKKEQYDQFRYLPTNVRLWIFLVLMDRFGQRLVSGSDQFQIPCVPDKTVLHTRIAYNLGDDVFV